MMVMPENRNNNAARRLLFLLQSARAMDPQLLQIKVWSRVFGVENLSGRPQKQAVSRGIDLMYEQLDLTVEQLKALHHTEESYRELVARMEQNISAEFLSHGWQDCRTRLEPIIYPLEILSNTLPNEENALDPQELKTLGEELNALERSLSEKHVSPAVREYVRRQVNIIRRAIWEYQFRGLRAFDDAVLEGIREAYSNPATVEDHKSEPEVQKVGNLWAKLWQAVINAGKVGAALAAGERFYQLVEKTLQLATSHHP